jgi:hypothetical protein
VTKGDFEQSPPDFDLEIRAPDKNPQRPGIGGAAGLLENPRDQEASPPVVAEHGIRGPLANEFIPRRFLPAGIQKAQMADPPGAFREEGNAKAARGETRPEGHGFSGASARV